MDCTLDVPPHYSNPAADSGAGVGHSEQKKAYEGQPWTEEQRNKWNAQTPFFKQYHRWPLSHEISHWQLHGIWPVPETAQWRPAASRPRSEAAESDVAAQSKEQPSEVVLPISQSSQSTWQPRQTAWQGRRAQPQESDPASCMAAFAALVMGFCCGKFW